MTRAMLLISKADRILATNTPRGRTCQICAFGVGQLSPPARDWRRCSGPCTWKSSRFRLPRRIPASKPARAAPRPTRKPASFWLSENFSQEFAMSRVPILACILFLLPGVLGAQEAAPADTNDERLKVLEERVRS